MADPVEVLWRYDGATDTWTYEGDEIMLVPAAITDPEQRKRMTRAMLLKIAKPDVPGDAEGEEANDEQEVEDRGVH
jgi:hypothetical protein